MNGKSSKRIWHPLLPASAISPRSAEALPASSLLRMLSSADCLGGGTGGLGRERDHPLQPSGGGDPVQESGSNFGSVPSEPEVPVESRPDLVHAVSRKLPQTLAEPFAR